MSSRKGIWLIFLGIILAVLLLVYKIKNVSIVDWRLTYDYENNQPYEVSILYKLLINKYKEDNVKVLHESFDRIFEQLDSTIKYDYVKIGSFEEYNDAELDALLNFAERGNNVFIANDQYEDNLLDSLFQYFPPIELSEAIELAEVDSNFCDEDEMQESLDSNSMTLNDILSSDSSYNDTAHFIQEMSKVENFDDTVQDSSDLKAMFYYNYSDIDRPYYSYTISKAIPIQFKDASLQQDSAYLFYYFYEKDTIDFFWLGFNENYFDSINNIDYQIITSYDESNIVYMDLPYGKGHIYLHLNPIIFSNVELLSENRLEYAEKVFSNLKSNHLLWDDNNNSYSGEHQTMDNEEERSKSPLSYFLANKALRWSIYLACIGGLLFVVFKAKRKQQYIPVIEPKTNTSLEYVEMMGQLYFKDQNHQFICTQLWLKFIDFLNEQYYIQVKENDTFWMERVADKSLVPLSKLNDIYYAYKKTKETKVSKEDLINLYDKLQYFYTNCK